MNANREYGKLETENAPLGMRKAFEYAACAVGVGASISLGLADSGSIAQLASATLTGLAYGTAYLLKR